MTSREIMTALDGAWEERGVIGTRIEIKKDRLTVLWRSGVVLDTKFKTEQSGEKVNLILASRGMRYAGASSDYATVTDLYLDGGALYFEEDFPITGKSVTKLEKTENSRYGNVTFVENSVLHELCGEWQDDSGYHKLVFKGDTLDINGEKIKIRVVRDASGGPCRIINDDPSKDGVGYFYGMEYLIEAITARIMVCDAPPVIYMFKRVKKDVK